MSDSGQPKVGVATVVVNGEGRVLVGRDTRKGKETYGVPGGHWESGETLKECAVREVKEESGIDCENVNLISVYDFYREDKGRSYLSVGMRADYSGGELINNTEEERTEWGWYDSEDALELPLFGPDKVLLERYLSGTVFE